MRMLPLGGLIRDGGRGPPVERCEMADTGRDDVRSRESCIASGIVSNSVSRSSIVMSLLIAAHEGEKHSIAHITRHKPHMHSSSCSGPSCILCVWTGRGSGDWNSPDALGPSGPPEGLTGPMLKRFLATSRPVSLQPTQLDISSGVFSVLHVPPPDTVCLHSGSPSESREYMVVCRARRVARDRLALSQPFVVS